MTFISKQIYDYLITRANVPVSMSDLEHALGVCARQLQSQGDTPGPLQVAITEIFEETGWILFSQSGRGGGVCLTNNIERVELAANRLFAHSNTEYRLANTLMQCVTKAREGVTQ